MTTRHRGGGGSSSDSKNSEAPSKPSSESPPPKKGSAFSGKFNPKLGRKTRPENTADDTFLSHQWWSRIVMVASIVLIVYWSNSSPGTTIMAKRSETLKPKRYQSFLCAPSYRQEIQDLDQRCAPTKCGRVVIDGLFSDKDVHRMLQIAKKGLAEGGSNGGASILDLHSGALSKGEQFVNLYKIKPGLYDGDDFEAYRKVKETVKEAVAEHFGIENDALYLTHPTFFSRMTNRPAKTIHDEYWHIHVDKETYPNFHYTSLLYLTDYGDDFEGGTFVFVDNEDKLNRTIEPKAGRVSAFTSGKENKHYVEKVTNGIRFALTMGFTCDPSKAITDPGIETLNEPKEE